MVKQFLDEISQNQPLWETIHGNTASLGKSRLWIRGCIELNIDFSEKVFCFSNFENIINLCLKNKFFEISILSSAECPKIVLRHMTHPVEERVL